MVMQTERASARAVERVIGEGMLCEMIGSSSEPRELLDELEDHVECFLGGRIREFRVHVQNGGLILEGKTRTYYAKQLAQHRVMEMTDMPILANDIEVV